MRNKKSSNGQLKILLFGGAILLALGIAVFGLSKVKAEESTINMTEAL